MHQSPLQELRGVIFYLKPFMQNEFKHKKGIENPADSLSRLSLPKQIEKSCCDKVYDLRLR